MIPGHDILVGLEARRLDRAEHKEELSQSTPTAASGYDKVAVYAQDQCDAMQDLLRVVAGLRYDRKTNLSTSKTSPRLSFVYTPNERLVVRGGYSTAFRFPTFSELYQASWFFTVVEPEHPGIPPFPFSVFNPNPDLKPEEISTFDLGGEYQISPTVSVKADLYRSRVKNFIVIVQHLLAPLRRRSDGRTSRPTRGSSAAKSSCARMSPQDHRLRELGAQTESQTGTGTDSSGHPFEFVYAPKDKVNFGAYAGPFNSVRAAVEASWKSSYNAPSNWFFIRSNFTSFATSSRCRRTRSSTRGSATTSRFVHSRPIRFTLFGNNLLNKRPEETFVGAENRLAGREFFGQVEVHF